MSVTPAEGVSIPEDAAVVNVIEVKTKVRTVKVNTLTVGGVLRVLAAVKKVGVKSLPQALSPFDALSPEQQSDVKNAGGWLDQAKVLQSYTSTIDQGARDKIAESAAARFDAMLSWALSIEQLLPALLAAFSDVTPEETMRLTPAEVLRILTAGMSLVDIPSTVEAAPGFFTQIGVLTDEFGRQRAEIVKEEPPSGGT